MNSSDFRTEARGKLSGKWGKAACISFAYFVIFFAIGFVSGLLPESMEGIFSLAVTVIEIPLIFGLIISFVKLFDGEDVGVFEFLSSGFRNFARAWGIALHTVVKLLVPIILMIISYVLIAFSLASFAVSLLYSTSTTSGNLGILGLLGFILLIVSLIWLITKSYYYQLANFIAIDNPEMTSKDAVLKSRELMQGKRGKLFCLQLSFIGWAILSAVTLGIGMLWLLPYMQFAAISFYKNALPKSEEPEVENTQE